METAAKSPIRAATDALGVPTVANMCKVSSVAVYKWLKKNRLPRTDWTGETNYAETIARALQDAKVAPAITRDQLLNGWQAGEFRGNADAQPAVTVQT